MKKNEENGVTRIAFTIIIIIILLLVGVITVMITQTIKNKKLTDAQKQMEEKQIILEENKENKIEQWEKVKSLESEWYDYGDKVNPPKLVGGMKGIEYTGRGKDAQTGNKWANAVTTDGSMFVWIPRYAYKITNGYHSNTAGKIEIAFIDKENNFLKDSNVGEITEDPKEEGAGTEKWLVHPAFTDKPENGGWDKELEGIWIGKFEVTGKQENITVQPGVYSLVNMTINEQYQAGKKATFGEESNELLGSHMAKNSEWGAVIYLSYSQYGLDGKEIEPNKSTNYITGGSTTKSEIYFTNKNQSTTGNAYGIYDMIGGAGERMAGYMNYEEKSNDLKMYGGANLDDLYGADEKEQTTSTKYKTVYETTNVNIPESYELAQKYRGDALYETSNSYSSPYGTWQNQYINFPNNVSPFFLRGGAYHAENIGSFYFYYAGGSSNRSYTFRIVLAI